MKKFAIAFLGLLLWSCMGAKLSFLPGLSDPDKYKTLRVENFFNDAQEGPANMGVAFTEKLRDYFIRNTPLKLVRDDNAHMVLEGKIASYRVSPVAPGGGTQQTAQLQRLTIVVEASYTDNVDETQSFTNQSFTFFQDFPANQNLTSVEAELVNTIFDQIVFDIFGKTYANW
jgi:hypothetical protein